MHVFVIRHTQHSHTSATRAPITSSTKNLLSKCKYGSDPLSGDDLLYDTSALAYLGLGDDEWRGQAYDVSVGRLSEETLVFQLPAHLHRVDLLVDDDRVEQTLATDQRNHVAGQLAQLGAQQLTWFR